MKLSSLLKVLTSAAVLTVPLFLCLSSNAETGVASVYDDWYDGRYTANGDIYYSGGYSAAACGEYHYGSYVTVTNLHNGRQVEVKINDTGGFCDNGSGRILDLSRAAFEALGGEYPGLLDVEVSR